MISNRQTTVPSVEVGSSFRAPHLTLPQASFEAFIHSGSTLGKLLRLRIGAVMAHKCDLCGKGPQFGNNISHAHNTTRRRWNVNLRPVKAQVNGGSKRIRVCTSCIKTGKVVKG